MSPDEMMPPSDCASADVAAYALGSLSPDEAQAFERHLQTCAVCPVELDTFQHVVDDLARGAPPSPAPRAIKRRVMREVQQDAEQRRPRSAAYQRRLRVPLGGAGLAFGTGVAFAVAAVIVVVLALPGRMGNRTVPATVVGSGTAALRISAGHTELVVTHFAAPPRGKIYEVWLQHGRTMEATTALFSVNAAGDASVDVPGSLYGVSHVLVTPEPAPDGSRAPTHAPVLDAALQT